ncbi:MAG: ATPase AAA [Pirellulaceae bacterium]|nr:MAG: ATPase AAA [Pirellulaceae bacterium]
MLTKVTISNFKRFGRVEIELGNPVVFIGPNNSGKTSALQAIALWNVGLRKWMEKRLHKPAPKERVGVAINRNDLIAVPVPSANLLWRNLRTRASSRSGGRQLTRNVRIEIVVEGVTNDTPWKCGFEFDYANEESFYCRPLRLSEGKNPERMPVPEEVSDIRIAFLPPISGLTSNETRLDEGAVHVRIGEGRTAEVLRNLCYMVHVNSVQHWDKIAQHIKSLFGAELHVPTYIKERGEIVMKYSEREITLDLSCAGAGLRQVLLLLAYLHAYPGAILLLDEPDAHLEILRQRQVYQLLTGLAQENGNQIIAASHSEVVLNEAAGKDVVVAFVGRPHRIDDRGSQVAKALREIGFEDYALAEQKGWVLYLEGPTDLAILQAFARRLQHTEATRALEDPFVKYVGNQPSEVRKHYFAVREAVPELKGIAIFDRLNQEFPANSGVEMMMWSRREIENYLCFPETLETYARASIVQERPGAVFAASDADRRVTAMRESIDKVQEALKTLHKGSPWSPATKVSNDFLVPLFNEYFKRLGLPNIMNKKNFHVLADYVPVEKIDPEVREKLDAICRTARMAKPVTEKRRRSVKWD